MGYHLVTPGPGAVFWGEPGLHGTIFRPAQTFLLKRIDTCYDYTMALNERRNLGPCLHILAVEHCNPYNRTG
jgi:hypothetical protein